MGLLVMMSMMRSLIPPMNVDIPTRHSAAEKQVEEFLGGYIGLKAARVVVMIVVAATMGTRMRFRLIGTV